MSRIPLAALLFLAACVPTTATSVPVRGRDTSVAMLAGKWRGEYEGIDSRRRGTITFDLSLGHHTAEGRVLMSVPGDEIGAVPLRIKFVNVGDGVVSGKMAAYTDPACRCSVETEFVGQVIGNDMNGTFTTTGITARLTQRGHWSAHRSSRD